MRTRTLEKIPGCYSRSVVLKEKDEIEHEIEKCHGIIREIFVYDINSVKEWLKEKYKKAKEDFECKFPTLTYRVAKRKCKELGLV